MQKHIPLEEGKFYHIYNRGINGEDLFREERNYYYFLEQYAKYVAPVVDTYAYCLLRNHFHLLVKIKDFNDPNEGLAELMQRQKWEQYPDAIKQFSHFFNSYAQSINSAYNRTGGLFESPFRRKIIEHERYFSQLVTYIHSNPQKHGFVKDFRDYPYSSFWSHLSKKETKLKRENVIEWFGNEEQYLRIHNLIDFMDSENEFVIEFD
jgi:putative transposase